MAVSTDDSLAPAGPGHSPCWPTVPRAPLPWPWPGPTRLTWSLAATVLWAGLAWRGGCGSRFAGAQLRGCR